ncbi:hypothetical protein AX14_009358, partial [Amanita brunnescens Koide BX004]
MDQPSVCLDLEEDQTHPPAKRHPFPPAPDPPHQFNDRIIIDTSSPKKGTEAFKAWVKDLKREIEKLHTKPRSVIIYTDGAFHHSDSRAAFAYTAHHNDTLTWHDHYGWCPAASSFDAELRAIEAALEYATVKTSYEHVTLIIDNKAAATSL